MGEFAVVHKGVKHLAFRHRWATALVAALVLLAVGAPPAAATDRQKVAPGDRSDKFFDPTFVHDVAIEVAPQDAALLQPGGTERVPASMTYDGIVVNPVGLRLKGGYASARPLEEKSGFSVKVDEYVDRQNIHGIEKFTLGNSVWDESFVAEQVSYDVWRAAGIPAPRTALANVRVNGEPYGLYVVREGYDKQFLRRNFAAPDGNLYEASWGGVDLSDTRLEARRNEETTDKSDITAVAQVVEKTPDATYADELGKLVDLRQLYRYWAVEALVAHFDGFLSVTNVPFDQPTLVMGNVYPNNYFAYHDPRSDKFVILPWGADFSLGNTVGLVREWGGNTDPQYLDESVLGGANTRTLVLPKAGARAVARLGALPGTRDRLRRTLLVVLDQAWNTNKLLARADQVAALVRANGPPVPRENWTPESFEAAFARRRAFIENRVAQVRAELGAPQRA